MEGGHGKVNVALQKKISSSCEAAIILEGAVGFQESSLGIFVKLNSPLHLVDLPEVDIPTRFFFLYAGPPGSEAEEQMYCNTGISLAVAFTDNDFTQDLKSAQNANDVTQALDEYMSSLKILPKDWPEEQKIDPPTKINKKIKDENEEEIDEDRRLVLNFSRKKNLKNMLVSMREQR